MVQPESKDPFPESESRSAAMRPPGIPETIFLKPLESRGTGQVVEVAANYHRSRDRIQRRAYRLQFFFAQVVSPLDSVMAAREVEVDQRDVPATDFSRRHHHSVAAIRGSRTRKALDVLQREFAVESQFFRLLAAGDLVEDPVRVNLGECGVQLAVHIVEVLREEQDVGVLRNNVVDEGRVVLVLEPVLGAGVVFEYPDSGPGGVDAVA